MYKLPFANTVTKMICGCIDTVILTMSVTDKTVISFMYTSENTIHINFYLLVLFI